MTSDEWQEGQRLLAAATPAPWTSGEDIDDEPLYVVGPLDPPDGDGFRDGVLVGDLNVGTSEEEQVANRDLIIWLRNHVHELRPVSIVHTGDAPWPTTRPA